MIRAIIVLSGLIILSGCPADAPDSTAGTTAALEQSSEATAGSSLSQPGLELMSRELKLGQRAQISIGVEGSYQLRIEQLSRDENTQEIAEEVDSFEPLSGPDSMNGWLPQETGDYDIILLDEAGTELDRQRIQVSPWPKGDPIRAVMPFVQIHSGEVTDDMQLEVGLPLVAYYLVPDDFPHDGWIGLFLVDEEFDGSATADDALDSALLMAERGQFNFWPKEPGRYVVRLFASHEIAASHVGDSQQITVIAKPK